MNYVADFETTTDPNDLRVWAWCVQDIEKGKFKIGYNINSFFQYVFSNLKNNSKIYFHNLKFDSSYIIDYLLKSECKHNEHVNDLRNKQFSTLITEDNIFYSLKIRLNNRNILFYDSLKLIPLSVDKIAKTFNLEVKKGSIDYYKHRDENYVLDENEIEYIKNDCEIIRCGVKFFLDNDLSKMTISANAFNDYRKNHIKDFRYVFPLLEKEEDIFIRLSYKGGYTYAKKSIRGKHIKNGVTYDNNSIYPFTMYEKELPYGKPVWFDGEYVEDDLYTIFIIQINVVFELKKDYLPTIQIKGNSRFVETEYLENSNGIVTLTLTNVDFNIFKKHYNINYINFVGGYKFKSSTNLFKSYIDKWVKVKQENHKKNEGLRTIAKLMLNSLYGKFARNCFNDILKKPYLKDNVVKYMNYKTEPQKMVYTAVASFITAYAREITINAAQENYDNFLYCDTDSIHCEGNNVKGIEIHETKLGAWKLEYKFTRAKFLRAKTYFEELHKDYWKYDKKGRVIEVSKKHIGCAGLPTNLHEKVTFENFKKGTKIYGKKFQKKGSGGIYFYEDYFTFR